MKKGKYAITVDFISYQPKTMELDLTKNEVLKIELIVPSFFMYKKSNILSLDMQNCIKLYGEYQLIGQ